MVTFRDPKRKEILILAPNPTWKLPISPKERGKGNSRAGAPEARGAWYSKGFLTEHA